ncbi:hypothetical protein EV361DRAFT_412847 [Lentinula raphanica]|nr:hypothetical protein EV361DRAFT_412847 [Lentinula raphanica]
MASKVRIISADTWRTRRLEEKAALKHAELVQLRDVARQLRLRYELQVDVLRLKSELDAATKKIHKLRLQILMSLGCNVADEQCLEAVLTNEEKTFWSLMDEVKSRSQNSLSLSHPSVHLAEGNMSTASDWSLADEVKPRPQNSISLSQPSVHLAEANISSRSDLPKILVQQCIQLDELAGTLRSGRNENTLRKQCTQLVELAHSFKHT